jgi:hypothetical protein
VTRLEDELRATFAARAAELPALEDAAGRAIRQAVRVRRRQAALAGLAIVITIGLVGIGVLHAPWPSGQAPVMADAKASFQVSTVLGIRLDLRVGNELWTADGRRVELPGAGAVTWVYRVPAGWVYGGTAGVLRMVLSDGVPADLDQPADAAVVSTDGQRIAWSGAGAGGPTLTVGQLTGTGVDTVARTVVRQPARPVAIVGSAVVVGLAKSASYDVWTPSTAFTPTWPMKFTSVYGDDGEGGVLGLADGVGALETASTGDPISKAAASRESASRGGLAKNAGAGDAPEARSTQGPVPDGPTGPASPQAAPTGQCLVRYRLSGVTAPPKFLDAGDCGLGLAAGAGRGSASPDGRWLAAAGTDGLMFVSLAGAVRKLARACPVKSRAAPVWEDSGAVLVATGEGLVRCRVDGSRKVIAVDGLPESGWDVVPALGV